MRRAGLMILILIFALLCSCASTETAILSAVPTPSESEQISTTPTDIPPVKPASPSPSPTQDFTIADIDARYETFRSFLSDNYQELMDAFFGGVSGIGFIDLDLDKGIEMLIFDAGASASMGLQIFDITEDGSVECVSANMDAVGTAFGGENLSSTIVNANYFDDFRLMKNKETGERFFVVQSANGAADFSYSQLIRFAGDNGVLTLEDLMYKYEEYDIDTGEIKNQSFKLAGKTADKSEYEAAYNGFFEENEDQGYSAMGCFIWESSDYGEGMDRLLAMADSALMKYYANSFFIE